MIWYYLVGFISGAVGMLMFLGHIGKRLEARRNEVQREDRREKTGEQN